MRFLGGDSDASTCLVVSKATNNTSEVGALYLHNSHHEIITKPTPADKRYTSLTIFQGTGTTTSTFCSEVLRRVPQPTTTQCYPAAKVLPAELKGKYIDLFYYQPRVIISTLSPLSEDLRDATVLYRTAVPELALFQSIPGEPGRHAFGGARASKKRLK